MSTFIEIAAEVLKNTASQLIFTVGLIAAFGLVIGLLNKAFFKLVGYKFGRIVEMGAGFIGVPVHEIGHALFCVIFGHKIVEMKLYQLNSEDGTLGYVHHVYNRKSIYHQIGNFFIAYGPILFGNALLLLLMYYLVPSLFSAFAHSSDFSEILSVDIFSLAALEYIYVIMREASVAFYTASNLGDWRWWAFMIPACSIALHMSLSVQDIKTSWAGFGFIAGTLLIANVVLYFVNTGMMADLTSYSLTASAFILSFLTVSVVFSLLLLLFGVVVRGIRRLRGS